LEAVAPDENWKTYLWLAPSERADDLQQLRRDFVHASLAEFSGDRAVAANEFKTLVPRLEAHNMSYRMTDYARAAILRLSH
ncbi:MAG: hypothetical protein ACRD2I_14410, partial [Vicinamibacterales bacterium]